MLDGIRGLPELCRGRRWSRFASFVRGPGAALVGPMPGGDTALPADTPAAADTPVTRGLARLLALACAALVAWVARAGG